MSNMSIQWDETHLCSRYNESDCEFFLKTDAETVFNGKKLDKSCYYCTSENKVRKIGTGGTWTGLSPKFCPKRKNAEKESADKQPTYIDKLRERYPNVNETDEWFDTVYCPDYVFYGKDVKNAIDEDCHYTTIDRKACQKCWRSPCSSDAAFYDILDDFEDEYYSHYPAEDTEGADVIPENSEEKSEADKSPENQIIPQDTSKISNTFNYAVLSTEVGDYLKNKEQQLKNEYFKFICKWGEIFADAQETLAKHGFGENNGIFHKWFDSLNLPISRRTMYRMISVYKFRSCQIGTNEEVQKIFDSFPKTSQYEIAEGKVPEELVEQVKNGDITTHKDYIALKKQYEEAAQKCADEYYKNQKAEEHIQKLNDEYTKLSREIEKLEKRPVDVYVDSNEVNRRVSEAVSKINSETEQTIAAREQEFAETLHTKDERIWELEDKLKELGAGNTGKKVYMLTMTDEEYLKMDAELISGDLRKILVTAAVIDPNGKRGGGNG